MGIPTESPLTPGPWKAHRGHVTAEVSTGTWDDEYNAKAYGGYMICESVFPGNAQAIAAIPQMIEALKRLTSNRRRYLAGDNDTCGKCGEDLRSDVHYRLGECENTDLMFARQAIAQAEGETT